MEVDLELRLENVYYPKMEAFLNAMEKVKLLNSAMNKNVQIGPLGVSGLLVVSAVEEGPNPDRGIVSCQMMPGQTFWDVWARILNLWTVMLRCVPCGLNGQSGQNVQQPAGEGNKLGLGSVYYPKEYKAVPGITKNQGNVMKMCVLFGLSGLNGQSAVPPVAVDPGTKYENVSFLKLEMPTAYQCARDLTNLQRPAMKMLALS